MRIDGACGSWFTGSGVGLLILNISWLVSFLRQKRKVDKYIYIQFGFHKPQKFHQIVKTGQITGAGFFNSG